MDHHCQWVNQCIGIGNHNYFMSFITLTWLYLAYILITCLNHLNPPRSTLLNYVAWNIKPLLAIVILDVIFLAPLTLLLIVQTLNYMAGLPTSARFQLNDEKKQLKKSMRGGLEMNLSREGKDSSQKMQT